MPIRGYGLMLMIGFLGGTWWAALRAARVKCDPDFIVNLGFTALIASVIGARMFYVIHYWDDHFAGRGLWAIINVSAGGMEFYGGFLGAMVGCLGYMLIKRVSIRLYLDILAPSLAFGMCMARIGCFLNGCCWGGIAPEIPWAMQFPYGSPAQYRQWEERQVTLPAELLVVNSYGLAYPLSRDSLDIDLEKGRQELRELQQIRERILDARAGSTSPEQFEKLHKQYQDKLIEWQKATGIDPYIVKRLKEYHLTPQEFTAMIHEPQYCSRRVHPAQLYASLDGLVLALLLSAYFYRRKRHGAVFGLLMLLYPGMRIAEEIIRTDNPLDTAGMTISQFISVLLIVIGAVWLLAIRKMPLRSPRAVPWTPPELRQKPQKARKVK